MPSSFRVLVAGTLTGSRPRRVVEYRRAVDDHGSAEKQIVYNACGSGVRQVDKHEEADFRDPAQSSELHGDERWELVARIAASHSFRKSPRLRQFLLFVTEMTLTGHAEEISEFEIGWKVFERGQDYSPSEDSIVRTAARQLRAKVKEYFESEGAAELWQIEIPKGGYVPIFTKRDVEQPPPPLVEHIVAPLPPASPVEMPSRLRRPPIEIVFAIVVLWAVIATVWLWRALARHSEPEPSIVSTVLADGDQPTHVVVGDFGLAMMSLATKHVFSVEQYANHSYFSAAPPEQSPVMANIWNLLGTGQIVSYPDVAVAGAIMRQGGAAGKKMLLQNAHQISPRDFRSGNYILLSAPIASPWMSLFQDKLNFRYRLYYVPDAPAPVSEFENSHPLPGEKADYRAAPTSPNFGLTYGLIARVPNLTGTGKVLLIFGLKYTGLEVAGEFATDPKRAAELARLLHVADIRQAPDFEVLVETDSLDAAPRYVRAVAARTIPSAK